MVSTSLPLSSADNQISLDTLDEPVSTTVLREVKAIFLKLQLVCIPMSRGSRKALHDWDLWGPLLLCLSLALIMSFSGSDSSVPNTGINIFTTFFAFFWLGAVIVSVNATLLGSTLSFFQSVCVLGYSLFPISVAAVLCCWTSTIILKFLFASLGFIWSSFVSAGFLKGANAEDRLFLVLYPMCLLFFAVSWMVLVISSKLSPTST